MLERSPLPLRAVSAVVVCLLLVGTSPREAHAEFPWFVVISGLGLDHPVVVDNRTLPIVAAVPSETDAVADGIVDLTARPHADLLLVFGDPAIWADYSGDPQVLAALEPSDSTTLVTGEFYPAVGSNPALFQFWISPGLRNNADTSAVLRFASEDELTALAEAGVPVVISTSRRHAALWWSAGVLGVLAALTLSARVVFSMRRT